MEANCTYTYEVIDCSLAQQFNYCFVIIRQDYKTLGNCIK